LGKHPFSQWRFRNWLRQRNTFGLIYLVFHLPPKMSGSCPKVRDHRSLGHFGHK
jgi:hypothetical protein